MRETDVLAVGRCVPGSEDRLLTQQEAARAAGRSKDTIARARRSGRLPHSRLNDGRWMIPAGDLIAAGLAAPDALLSPADGEEDDGSVDPAILKLAQAEARVAALEDLVARQDDELCFLRQLATETLGRRAS